MRLIGLVAMAGLLFASAASASGFRPPAHSDLAYSFTCPSGASGHLRYVIDFSTEFAPKLTLWVNGQYIHEDPDVVGALRGRNVEQLQASCEGDRTRVWVRTFNPETSEQGTVTIDIDRTGKVLAAQYGA
jgi:hypothetical protein